MASKLAYTALMEAVEEKSKNYTDSVASGKADDTYTISNITEGIERFTTGSTNIFTFIQNTYNKVNGAMSFMLNILGDVNSMKITKENAFTKNTAFNKNFGTSSGSVMEGNDSRVVNAFQKTDIETTEPTANSTDVKVTSSKRLWTMMGAALSTLKTTSKTIVNAINEVYDRIGTGTLTVYQSGKNKGTFGANQASNGDISVEGPFDYNYIIPNSNSALDYIQLKLDNYDLGTETITHFIFTLEEGGNPQWQDLPSEVIEAIDYGGSAEIHVTMSWNNYAPTTVILYAVNPYYGETYQFMFDTNYGEWRNILQPISDSLNSVYSTLNSKFNNYIQAPASQTANTQIMLAPATKGAVPTLRNLNTIVKTSSTGVQSIYGTVYTINGAGTARSISSSNQNVLVLQYLEE